MRLHPARNPGRRSRCPSIRRLACCVSCDGFSSAFSLPETCHDALEARFGNLQIPRRGSARVFFKTVEHINRVFNLGQINEAVPAPSVLLAKLENSLAD